MKRKFVFARMCLLVLLGTLWVSCVREPASSGVLSEEEQVSCMDYADVAFSLDSAPFLADIQPTKAQALSGADDKTLGGALVLIYRHVNRVLDSYSWFTPSQLSSGADLTVSVPLVPCDVYVLGNLVAVSKADASVTANLMEAFGADFPVTEDRLEDFVYRLDGKSFNGVESSSWRTETMEEVKTYGIPYQFVDKGVDMAAVVRDGLPFPSGKATWLFSKVTVTVDHSTFDGGAPNFEDYFLNNAIYIRQPNLKMRPFSTSGVCAETSDDLGTRDVDGDRDVAMSQAHAGSYVFFVPENMKGVVSSVDHASKKNKDNAGIDASVRDYASFVEFSGTVGTAAGGFSGDVRYQFYLGGNATTDFNVQRGHAYSVTLQFSVGGLFGEPKWMVTPSLTDSRRFQVTADASFSTDIETVNAQRMLAVRKNRPGKVYVYMNTQNTPGSSNALIGKDVTAPSAFLMDDLGDCSWYGDFMTAGTADAQWLAERGIVAKWDKTDGSLSFSVDPAMQAQFDAHVGEEKELVLRLLPLETKTATVKVRLAVDLVVSVGDGKSLTDDFYLGQKRTVSVTGFSGSGIHWAAVQQGCGDSSHTNLNDASNLQWKTSSDASAVFPSCAVDAGGRVVLDPTKSEYASQVFSGSLDLYAFYPNRFQAGHGFTSKNGTLVVFGSDWLNDCVEIPVRISEPQLKTVSSVVSRRLPLDGTPVDAGSFGYMSFDGVTRMVSSDFESTLYNSLLALTVNPSTGFSDCVGIDTDNLKIFCSDSYSSVYGDLSAKSLSDNGVVKEGSSNLVGTIDIFPNAATGLWSGSSQIYRTQVTFTAPVLRELSVDGSHWSTGDASTFVINYFKESVNQYEDDESFWISCKYYFTNSDLANLNIAPSGNKTTYTVGSTTYEPIYEVQASSYDTGSGGILQWVYDESHQAKQAPTGEKIPGGLLLPYGEQSISFTFTNRHSGREITMSSGKTVTMLYSTSFAYFVGAVNSTVAKVFLVPAKNVKYLKRCSESATKEQRTWMTKLFGHRTWCDGVEISKAFPYNDGAAQYHMEYPDMSPGKFPLSNFSTVFLPGTVLSGAKWTSAFIGWLDYQIPNDSWGINYFSPGKFSVHMVTLSKTDGITLGPGLYGDKVMLYKPDPIDHPFDGWVSGTYINVNEVFAD